jgi:hypothetical protein
MGSSGSSTCSPLRVHKADVQALPDIYRALAEYLIETGDPRIAVVDDHEA